MAHAEMIASMIYQLMKDATINEMKQAGLDSIYTEHGKGIYPSDANGVPFSGTYFSVTGDFMADLEEDLAAEQKARAIYENLMNETTDSNLLATLSFLRQREVVHYERFKELRDMYKKKYKRRLI